MNRLYMYMRKTGWADCLKVEGGVVIDIYYRMNACVGVSLKIEFSWEVLTPFFKWKYGQGKTNSNTSQ